MKCALSAALSALMLAFVGVLAALSVSAVATALIVAFLAGGAWAMASGILAVAILAAVGAGLLTARRRRARLFVGVPDSSNEHPLLWVEINRGAEGLSTRPPDELTLVPGALIVASEHLSWLGARPGVRHLRLGLPLLLGLTQRQLRAVMTEELGRRWGPASLDRIIHRGKEIIGAVVEPMGADSRVARTLRHVGGWYLSVSGPVCRRLELKSDRLCAELAGNVATVAAFREVAVLGRGWDAFVKGYLEPAAAVGLRPHEVFAGFACFLEDPDRRAQLEEEAVAPEPQQASADDSQLTLGDRLAAIASLPEDDMHDTTGPAMDLLRDPARVISAVEESMFRGSGLVPAAWEDILSVVGRAAAREDALQLVELGREGGLGPKLSVTVLLEIMSLGMTDEMVRPMLPAGASPEEERLLAGLLVTGFLATAAIETGTASYRFSWAVPQLLVDEHGGADNLALLVHSALADKSAVPALEQWLKSHRVGPELELGADLRQTVREGRPGAPAENPQEDLDGGPLEDLDGGPPEDLDGGPPEDLDADSLADPLTDSRPLLVPLSGTITV